MSILITAATCPEAYRLRRLLDFEKVTFADYTEMPLLPGFKQVLIPSAETASFAHVLLSTCLDLGITEIYPLRMREVLELAQTRQLFLEYGILPVIPSDEFLRRLSSFRPNSDELSIVKNGQLLYPSGVEWSGLDEENGLFIKDHRHGETYYTVYIVDDAKI
jgi:hypothetical protein